MLYSIVVTYNGVSWIRKCLSSLVNSSAKNHHIVVIDNQSQDDTVSVIKREFPSVQLLEPGENLGFGKANNLGMQLAMENDADFVFLLNQDAWVENNTIESLINECVKYPDYGILAPKQFAADGSLDSQFEKYYRLSKPDPAAINIRECKFVNAAGWLMTRSCLRKVGGFSPLYQHYGEDADYCKRMVYYGMKIGIDENTSFIHDRGGRVSKNMPVERQTKEVAINQTVTLANINHNLILLFIKQYLGIVKKLFTAGRSSHITFKAYLSGVFISQSVINDTVKFRKMHKSGKEYLFIEHKA